MSGALPPSPALHENSDLNRGRSSFHSTSASPFSWLWPSSATSSFFVTRTPSQSERTPDVADGTELDELSSTEGQRRLSPQTEAGGTRLSMIEELEEVHEPGPAEGQPEPSSQMETIDTRLSRFEEVEQVIESGSPHGRKRHHHQPEDS